MVFYFVPQNYTAIWTRFGRFMAKEGAGLTFYIPFVDDLKLISNKTLTHNNDFRVKTKDNVSVDLGVGCNYRVKEQNSYKAAFLLDDYLKTMNNDIGKCVREKVTTLNLDSLYEEQGNIEYGIQTEICENMEPYGFTIEKIVISEITPDPMVEAAMNKINAATRMEIVAETEAKAEYIRILKNAQARCEERKCKGEGFAKERREILKGYKESISEMSDKLGISPKDLVDFILRTQELDTYEKIGSSPNAKTIFLGNSGTDNSTFSGYIKAMENNN